MVVCGPGGASTAGASAAGNSVRLACAPGPGYCERPPGDREVRLAAASHSLSEYELNELDELSPPPVGSHTSRGAPPVVGSRWQSGAYTTDEATGLALVATVMADSDRAAVYSAVRLGC